MGTDTKKIGLICKSDNHNSLELVSDLIQLARRGDTESLTELRNKLRKSRKEIAEKVGVSELKLKYWESGKKQPSTILHAHWKLRLSDYIDEKISSLIHTHNPELIHRFWEIMWMLDD
jgi:DNA-binding transcriptional regulator YiaG